MYCITESFLLFVGKFRLFQVASYSLWIISSRFLLVEGHFRFFLAHCRLFQVVSCALQVVSGCFLLTVGRFSLFLSFLARCRQFQVVSGYFLLVVVCFSLFHFVLQVISRSLQVVSGRFRSFLARCRSFQVVSGCSAFQQVPVKINLEKSIGKDWLNIG